MSANSFGQLGLSITGLGTQYPPYGLKSDAIDILVHRYHDADAPAMKKILSINKYTGIESRSSIGNPDHPIVNHPEPPSIEELHEVFIAEGVPLAVSAAQKAIAEARIDLAEITHVVSTSCTDSANPGYDHFVCQGLGITHQVEKVLLHGIGCSGGLAALRTAANLALGHSYRGKPAKILVIALEVSTTFVRSELDSIDKTGETRIGVCLFSDCASAAILSNDVSSSSALSHCKLPVYDLLGWDHRIVPDTAHDLGFDAHRHGWKVVLTPRVPTIAQDSLQSTFTDLMSSLKMPSAWENAKPADFDWAMHPGGATILTGAEQTMGLKPEHMRASYDVYMNHGNSSSATIFSVLDRMRSKDMDACTPDGRGPREYVVGCAFGPGVSVEMCMLKRNLSHKPEDLGVQTPPETESEDSSDTSEAGEEVLELEDGHGEGKSKTNVVDSYRDEESFISQALASMELD
ncbi:thiolase-like protein [Coniella lustricola]|uniref:Thiolase-like protein n=1 Tax=Coniella lustricola TaxID=2025994 RepID=A0A2T3AM58_9PEZI|nr:thiolase-like protein [Coniella lustricola]